MMNRQPENGLHGLPTFWLNGNVPHSVQPFGDEPSPFHGRFQAAAAVGTNLNSKPFLSSQLIGSLKTRFPVFRLPFHCSFKKSILPAAAQRLVQAQQILPLRQPCPHQRFLRLAGGDFGGEHLV